jgi:hypothetical protein
LKTAQTNKSSLGGAAIFDDFAPSHSLRLTAHPGMTTMGTSS